MNRQESQQPKILKKAIQKQKKPIKQQAKYEFKKIGGSNNSIIYQQFLIIQDEPKITKPINKVYKVIPHQKDNNNNLVCNKQCQDLRNEYQIMSEMEHQNVFKPDFCKNDGKNCTMGMPKADCDGYQYLVQNMKNLQISETKKIFQQAAKGLAYIHRKNYAHNDLKLANIFFMMINKDDNESQKIQIADFGFSKKQENINAENQYARWAGRNINTLAPEILNFISQQNQQQQQQGFCEKSADIFAFGLCLFQYIFYMPAFGQLGASQNDPLFRFFYNGDMNQYWGLILNQAQNGQKNLDRIRSQVKNDELQQILSLITKCLQKSAVKRPTGDELANDPWFKN